MYIDKKPSSKSLQRSLPRFPEISRGRPAFIGFIRALKPLPWQLIPKTYTVKCSILPAKDIKISGAFGNQRKHLPDYNEITTTLSLFHSFALNIMLPHTCRNNKHKECLRHVHCVLGKACSSFRCMTHFLLLIQMCWIADSLIVCYKADLLRSDSEHFTNINHKKQTWIYK